MSILKSIASKIPSEVSFSISAETIQKEVSKKFPQTYTQLSTTVTLYDPVVILKQGCDAIDFEIKARAKFPLLEEKSGTFSASSEIDFNKDLKVISIKNINSNKFEMDGVSEKFIPALKKVADFALEKILKNYPIYFLDGKLSRNFVKNIKIENEKLTITIGL